MFDGIEGVSVFLAPERALDGRNRIVRYGHDIDIVRYIECIVTIAAPAISYVATRLLDRLKEKGKNERVVINNIQITGDNNIVQITNAIEDMPKD